MKRIISIVKWFNQVLLVHVNVFHAHLRLKFISEDSEQIKPCVSMATPPIPFMKSSDDCMFVPVCWQLV